MPQDHWLTGFNYNVEEWNAEGLHYETLAICRNLALARAAFKEAIAEKPSGRFMIRSRSRSRTRAAASGDWSLSRLCSVTLDPRQAARCQAPAVPPRFL
jgi:hypothetical protein